MQRFTIQRVALVTLFGLIFVLAMHIPTDPDTWWHIRSGEYTLQHGMIRGDPFSHTKVGEEWINHSWGAQILLYVVWKVAGNVGLALYTATLATAGMVLIYPVCAGNVYTRAFVLVLGAATAAVFWSARPQMVSFFFSAVIIYLLYSTQYRQIDRLWFIPPLLLVWGNLHAGFSIAFILIGGFLAGGIAGRLFDPQGETTLPWAKLKKLGLVTLVAVAALIVNPYGIQILRVPYATISIGALQNYIEEWNSPNFHERNTWPFVFLLLALLGAAGASKKRLDWTSFFLVSGTAFMGLLAGRNIATFAIVATPVLSWHVHALLVEHGWDFQPARRVTRVQARLNLLLLLVITLGAVSYLATAFRPASVDRAQREFLPVQVAEFLRETRPAGPMFNSYNWGGYLLFALPEYPVYVDGRTDLYGDEFLLRFLNTIRGGDGWRAALDEDGINLVVIEADSGLAQHLREEPGWTLLYPNAEYADAQRVIFARAVPIEP